MKRLALVTVSALGFAIMLHPSMSRPATGTPFFMFSTSKFTGNESSGIDSTLRTYVRGQDYLSERLATEFPEVGKRVDPAHVYVLPPSLKAVERHIASRCAGGAGLIVYDGEHWQDTPEDEQADMPGAIARGKTLARGGGCQYGVAPDGQFVGLLPKSCSYDLNDAIHRRVDWSDIALFNVQAQRLLSDSCVAQGGLDSYVRFVGTVAREVRAKSANTKISAQLSFRYTPPQRMLAAIDRLRGSVDGFYIAYPSNVGPSCTYCSPQNLAQVLKGLRE